MNKKKREDKPENRKSANALRRRAEDELKQRFGAVEPETLSVEDARRLVHELQVHQIELEMQNEELRVAQSMLEESRAVYSNLYDFAPVGYFTFDREGVILEVNLTGAALLGVERTHLIKKPFTAFLTRDSQDAFYLHRRKVRKSGERQTCELKLKGRDGSEFFAELESLPAEDNTVRTAVSDITGRKHAEEELVRLASYPELNPNPVIELDDAGNVHYLNPAAKNLFGNVKPDRHPFLAGIHEELGDKVDMVRDVKFDDYWHVQSVNRVTGSNRIRIYARDITDRKRAEEELNQYRQNLEQMVEARTSELIKVNKQLKDEMAQRQKMEDEMLQVQKLESVGILAGGIAHDFNNALTAIMNNVSAAKMLLKSETRSDKAVETLDAALNTVRRTTKLAYQLLTFSEGGEPVRKVAYVRNLIADTAEFSLRGSKVKSEFNFAEDLWPAYIDEGQIVQVISNLVINADQSMPEGGAIEVSAENIKVKKNDSLPLYPGRYIKLTVKDHGKGIPKKDIAKIFDPYFTTKEEGSGLGLASAYSIIKKHGGLLTVETEQGRGTSFYVYLPASAEKVIKDERIEDSDFMGAKILLMDDEEDVRDSVASALALHGFEPEVAEDGSMAVKAYEEAMKSGEPFDAVVMDLTVRGGMGGIETVREIQKINPTVKAVVISGYSNDPVMADYAKFGFVRALRKPFDIEELSRILQDVITGKSQ